MASKPKALIICPFCEEDQARTWQGMTQHVRAKHPDKIQEFKDNKVIYLEKFACDEAGNPTAKEPEPPATPPAEPPEPKEKLPQEDPSAPEVTPPEQKEKPAEGGGFLDTLKEAIDGLPG